MFYSGSRRFSLDPNLSAEGSRSLFLADLIIAAKAFVKKLSLCSFRESALQVLLSRKQKEKLIFIWASTFNNLSLFSNPAVLVLAA